ncbi:uncharacterized protein LOC113271858 [Papaver somniferum]|uniref:uncharacterized protein LOC113271858 n=1 Tax=Papaver somniferum TaxID=3469 RepID=UPI000E702D40|nr:uncharacterized protein LOC113271858 [Papaver somniferum]
MGTWYNRRTESASWVDGNLVPTAVTLIKKMLEFVTDYGVDPCVAGELYMVTSPKNSVFTVNILAKTCSCLQWQLRGFPCMHAVSALHSIRPQWRKYCSDYYSVENYKATYAPTFAPLDDKSEWVQPNMNKKILNLVLRRQKGGVGNVEMLLTTTKEHVLVVKWDLIQLQRGKGLNVMHKASPSAT